MAGCTPLINATSANVLCDVATAEAASFLILILKSYNSYPTTSFQNKYSLSESGFRYSGIGDIVECFFCGLVLKKWTKDEIPWVEHAKWNPKCIFVLLCKGNEFIENVKNEYVKSTDVCDCNQTKS
ncbi:hypothetical protein QTP88_029265 [Uroleucon formosanum]